MMRRHAFRVLAGVLILGAVIHVLTVWPRVTELGQTLGPGTWLVLAGYGVAALTALSACALALLLLWKGADRPDARALTFFLGFLAFFWGSLFRFLEVGSADRSIQVNLSYDSGWVSQTALISFVLMFPAFLRFATFFPERLTADRLPALRLARSPVLRAARRLRIWFLDGRVVWGSAIAIYLIQRLIPRAVMSVSDLTVVEQGGAPPPAVLVAFLASILMMAGYAVFTASLGVRNLRTSYRLAGAAERRRIQWVFAGFATAWWLVLAGAGLVVVSIVLPDEPELLGVALPLALFIAPLVVVTGAAVGILYAGAIDPALALEKSTVYGVLGAVGLVAFAALESVLSELLEAWVPLPGLVGPVAAGALVAIALIPVRVLLRRRISPWRGDGRSSD